MNDAKTLNCDELFHKYRNDMEMTRERVVCKSSSKRKELQKIIADPKVIGKAFEYVACSTFFSLAFDQN